VIAAPEGKRRDGARHREVRPAPAGAPVTRPTAIPGVERKRIAVTAAEIEALSPGVAPETATRAVRLVQGFVIEGAHERDVTLWGHAAQQAYADIVSRTLELAQAEVLGRVRVHLARIVALLEAIDVEAACGTVRPAGLIGRLFGAAGARIDTPRALAAARVELDQLVQLTQGALDPLLGLRDALDEQVRGAEAAGREIEAAALAAAFLADHLAERQPMLSRRFLERGMSLTQSAAQIRGGGLLRAGQVEQPLALIAAIQNVVLVTLPAWLGGIAALTSASPIGRAPNPTEAGELQHCLRTMLHDLKA
jgi:hypothetical protein